jgi:hypothetical protein
MRVCPQLSSEPRLSGPSSHSPLKTDADGPSPRAGRSATAAPRRSVASHPAGRSADRPGSRHRPALIGTHRHRSPTPPSPIPAAACDFGRAAGRVGSRRSPAAPRRPGRGRRPGTSRRARPPLEKMPHVSEIVHAPSADSGGRIPQGSVKSAVAENVREGESAHCAAPNRSGRRGCGGRGRRPAGSPACTDRRRSGRTSVAPGAESQVLCSRMARSPWLTSDRCRPGCERLPVRLTNRSKLHNYPILTGTQHMEAGSVVRLLCPDQEICLAPASWCAMISEMREMERLCRG